MREILYGVVFQARERNLLHWLLEILSVFVCVWNGACKFLREFLLIGLNRNIKFQLDYNQTHFTGGAGGGASRAEEKVLFSRMQIAF